MLCFIGQRSLDDFKGLSATEHTPLMGQGSELSQWIRIDCTSHLSPYLSSPQSNLTVLSCLIHRLTMTYSVPSTSSILGFELSEISLIHHAIKIDKLLKLSEHYTFRPMSSYHLILAPESQGCTSSYYICSLKYRLLIRRRQDRPIRSRPC